MMNKPERDEAAAFAPPSQLWDDSSIFAYKKLHI